MLISTRECSQTRPASSWVGSQPDSTRSLSHVVWNFEVRGRIAWIVVLTLWLWLGQHFLLRWSLPTDWAWK